jgi:outer membrane protein TolC
LGVLLFANPRSPYTVALPAASALPDRAATEAAASASNPELASALASLRSAALGVTAARAAYLPDLSLNYSYGIDAAQLAANGPDHERNLGYSASVAIDVPVWDWFATAHRVKQAQILRDSAKVALSATQRRLIANLEESYNEARVAHDQLDSLQLSSDTARESLKLTRLRYTAGEATVLEVVDAQNSLTAAELALEDGTLRYQLALANLQTLTGTL